jgi:NADPH:quinone reductase-like Zn-dependent oxidoreductase
MRTVTMWPTLSVRALVWFSLGGGLVRSIVITGVSTGIGYGAASEFARHGYRVYGSVRKREDAERLAREFGSGFVPLVFDVTDEEAVREAAGEVGEALGGSGAPWRCNRSRRSERTSRSTWWV